MLGTAKPVPGSVPKTNGGEVPGSAQPTWKITLSLLVLSLVLALLVGVAVGVIAFIRWRGIW